MSERRGREGNEAEATALVPDSRNPRQLRSPLPTRVILEGSQFFVIYLFIMVFVKKYKWENTSLPVLLIDNSEIEDSAEVTNFIPVSLNRQIIRSYLGLKILCKRTIHLLFLPLAIRSAETKKSLFVYIFTHLFI